MQLVKRLRLLTWDALFLLRATLYSAVLVAIWIALRSHGIAFQKDSEALTAGSVIIGLFDGIVSTYALVETWSEQKEMAAAIIERDQRKYMRYRDEHVPRVIYLYAGVLSILLILCVMFMHYDETACGYLIVGGVSFSVVMFFMVLAKLDDPRGSPWFKHNTPAGWDQVSLGKYQKKFVEQPTAAAPGFATAHSF